MYNRWKPPNDELRHYGVLGMKWGVRKARSYQSKADGVSAEKEKRLREAGFSNAEIAKLKKKSNTVFDKKGVSLDYYKRVNSEKAEAQRKSVDTKASKKLDRLNSRYQQKQERADRKFRNAEAKANSLLATKSSADRAFAKASKWQYKANKAAYKGKKWYEQMQKAYKKGGITMSDKTRRTGEELVRRVASQSQAMYAASYRR